MEKFPTPERNSVEKQAVLDALSTKGLEDPETMELVTNWTIQEEEKADSFEGVLSNKARVLFETERAELYVAAGDIKGAIGCFRDALDMARGENDERLYGEVVKIINERRAGNLVFT